MSVYATDLRPYLPNDLINLIDDYCQPTLLETKIYQSYLCPFKQTFRSFYRDCVSLKCRDDILQLVNHIQVLMDIDNQPRYLLYCDCQYSLNYDLSYVPLANYKYFKESPYHVVFSVLPNRS